VYVQNEISYKTYISDFSNFKNCWNGAVLELIYGTTLVLQQRNIETSQFKKLSWLQ